ncbi:hypothetical protein DFH94DRAFT_457336 [Russula ochroleuca]|uniref:Uncharacterized protein n=1 Tax=Russula ochroleuca TaxID=152965 RepID=A0A9P5MVT4_9AGAM|nr:hypothetical protein DFH94DRAFT_457336 [Russula ochroleuca]
MASSPVDPLTVYAAHSFENDSSYQAGLSTLYSSGAIDGLSGETKEDFLRRSRVFYFNQAYGCNISESDAKQLEEDRTYAPSTPEGAVTQDQEVSPSTPESPRTLTFAELQSLVEQGKTDEIPNNKHIPNIINEAAPSQSDAPQRKKPWEFPLQLE